MRSLQLIVFRATLSARLNVRILMSQHEHHGFPYTPTSGNSHSVCSTSRFQWRSSRSSVETRQSDCTAMPSVIIPIGFGSSHMTHPRYTGHMPIISALPNGVASKGTLTNGSGKITHHPLIPRSQSLASTIIHPLLTPQLQRLGSFIPRWQQYYSHFCLAP